MEDINATVTILDRKYKLKISPADEPALRKAAESIDNQARLYAKSYAYKDHQDLISMVALTQVMQLTKILENKQYSANQMETKLTEIDSILTEETKNLHRP